MKSKEGHLAARLQIMVPWVYVLGLGLIHFFEQRMQALPSLSDKLQSNLKCRCSVPCSLRFWFHQVTKLNKVTFSNKTKPFGWRWADILSCHYLDWNDLLLLKHSSPTRPTSTTKRFFGVLGTSEEGLRRIIFLYLPPQSLAQMHLELFIALLK